jgi:DNA transformation protein
MAVNSSFLDYVLEQLGGLGRVTSRRMFGAAGLYCDGAFFGLIADDDVYFKVDDCNRGDYLARGMAPFRPYRDRPERSMSYYRLPVEVLEDSVQITDWARAAVRAALNSPPKTAARRRPVPATGSKPGPAARRGRAAR